jgi:hypothetical protein
MQLEELSNISDNLAMMPDPALQQFAQLHKQDPYMVSLALSESNRRKKIRTAKQGQAGAMPQPKVVDSAIQGMTPAPAPVAQTQLPENQGIAQIPAPTMQRMADGGIAGYGDDEEQVMPMGNMSDTGGRFNYAQQGEPVIRMAEGGMLNFSSGGTKKLSGAELFDKALDMEGITNPRERAFLKALHAQESSGKATEKTSNRDAHGAMQILPATFKSVADAGMDINKPLDNMRAGIRYGLQGFSAAKGDPVLAGAYYYGGPGGMQKAAKGQAVSDPKNPKAPNTLDYGNSIAKRMTAMLPIGSAVAEEVPGAKKAPVDTSTAAQIPGQNVQAPASNYDQTNSFFGRIADKMGIPLEAQRQIGTTLNAPTPLAPVVGSAKSGSGIVALGEKIGDKLGFLQGPKGRMSPQEIAALQKESGGLKALEASQQVTKEAQAAGATLDEQEYLRKMVEANRAKEAADKYSKSANIAEASMLREGQDVATAQRLSKTGQQAQAAGRTESLANTVLPPDSAAPAANTAAGKIPFKGIDDAELQRMQEANQSPMTSDDIVKAAEEVTPAKERKGFSNDDLLTLGLNLLASKSPNFMTALGEAGLATVASKKDREKLEREQTMLDAELGYKKAKTKEAEAAASLIERGGKEKKMEVEAERLIKDHMSDWLKSNEGKFAGVGADAAAARKREEDRVRTAIYARFGISPIMSPTSASSGVRLSASDSELINKYLR